MERKIIAVNGLIGSGKNTFSQYFVDEGYQSCSFAESLKDSTAVIFGWERHLLEGDTLESREFRETEDTYWTKRLDLGVSVTPRWVLQNYGTNILRRYFHDNIWLYSLENKILRSDWEKIIITDCRFSNEIALVRMNKGTVIEVQRGEQPSWYDIASHYNLFGANHVPSELQDIHVSEWAWIGVNRPDFVVHNNSTLDHLEREASRILKLI